MTIHREEPMAKEHCEHKRLGFGSGAYYLICQDCNQYWAAVGGQPEYGTDANGRPIGANPKIIGLGPRDGASRVAPDSISDGA